MTEPVELGAQRWVPSVLEAQAYPDNTAAWALTVTPGSAVVKPLAMLGLERMSQAGRVDALIAYERVASWVAAQQVRVLAAMADDDMSGSLTPELDKQWVKEDVRAALGESAVGAGARLLLATDLTHRLPATLTALESGVLTVRQARHLAESLIPLNDSAASIVETEVLDWVRSRSSATDWAGYRRRVRRAVVKADPRTAEQQYADALTDRRVSVMPGENGMSSLFAFLPADGAEALMTILNVKADQSSPNDPRSTDQRRADALVQLVLDALAGHPTCPTCNGRTGSGTGRVGGTGDTGAAPGNSGSTGPRWQGMRPSVQVTVALSTLLGYDQQPGELDGHGPISADLARRIAADPSGTWRRLLTDERGYLIDYGRSTYRPPADLTRFVIARDRTCRFPTCNRKAGRCELDHATAWEDGGETNADNLNMLCCRHHHGKHERGWQLQRLPDGGIKWTSPTGHRYVVPAATYPIDRTVTADKPSNEAHPATEAGPAPPDDPPY